jgi:hypothetical protein
MSLQECTQALRTQGSLRINAGEYSVNDLEAAALAAREAHAMLVVYNLRGRSHDDVARIASAGGRQIIFDDVRLI